MPLILGAQSALAAAAGPTNSCRFNRADGPNMTKTPGSSGNLRKWTWSAWVKRGSITNGSQTIFNGITGSDNTQLRFDSDDTINFYQYAGSYTGRLATDRRFRDITAWYHIVAHWDTDNAAGGDRMKLFVNGVEESQFGADVNPAQYLDSYWGASGSPVYVGDKGDGAEEMDGYLAEVCFIDGQLLAPTSFGEFNEDSPGIWQPISISGLTPGTNGFYLDFKDSANLGNDAFGGTDLTENNITAYDQAHDNPNNNFATGNPLDNYYNSTTFTEGNCYLLTDSSAHGINRASTGLTAGLWYFEVKLIEDPSTWPGYGIADRPAEAATDYLGQYAQSWGYFGFAGGGGDSPVYHGGSDAAEGLSFPTFEPGDVMSCYIDLNANKLYFAKDNVMCSTTGFSLTASADTFLGAYWPAIGEYSGSDTGTFALNFGGCPGWDLTSAVTDSNDYGSFEYDPSRGGATDFDGSAKDFLAICTKNLGSDGG